MKICQRGDVDEIVQQPVLSVSLKQEKYLKYIGGDKYNAG